MSETVVHVVPSQSKVTEEQPLDGYAKEKAVLRGRNQSVTRPIPRLSSDIIPTKMGRKRKMTPTKMLNGINRFFKFCEEHDEMPTIKGMMIHMKMYREDFYRYAKDPIYMDMMEQARLIVSHWAEIDVYNTKGMAAGKIAYMKNVEGWSEKVESKNQTEVRQISVDEAISKIEMLAPRLLEVMKSQNTVNQIANPVEDAEYEKTPTSADKN